MSIIAPFIIWTGKSFGAGLLNGAGWITASALAPVVVPKISSFLKDKFGKKPGEEEQDPDLC